MCAFGDAVKLKYINLNDIIQFNDFMMHIKREIDSFIFTSCFAFYFIADVQSIFTIDEFFLGTRIPLAHIYMRTSQ